ncbi:uncharacterized protein LOC117325543 [Pecten maximus]|uniref:uncharacterized protein LOC117325543 n=1 Tax=Pecten maximus TaxID=6579 RepID=UPI001457EAAA|nr:uncharacterized protein LOC117325543 [Pecten maximus]
MAKWMWSVGVMVVIGMVVSVSGHGDVKDPPSRGLVAGYHTPWGVNCGGRTTQIANGGKCGPCGDDITQSQPRPFEEGGTYYNGAAARKQYDSGDTIPVVVRITANHLGFFDFKLCPSANKTRRTTELEQCLDQYPLDIIDDVAGTRGKKWPLAGNVMGDINLKIVLPTGVTCDHCILRWDWIGGNNCCGAPQEEFRNCMDIEIIGDSNLTPAPTPAHTQAPTPAPTLAPILTSCPSQTVLGCTPVPPLPSIDCLKDWCTNRLQ